MKVERAERLPYPGGYPVFLARYVLYDEKGKKVAMHFFNASEVVITGLRFRLTEKDEKGEEIAEHLLERRKLFVERGSEFAVADTEVSAQCASVEAQVEAVYSDDYEYVAEGDGMRLRYGVPESAKPQPTFQYTAHYKVTHKRRRYILLSLLAVLGFALLSLGLALRLGIEDEVTDDGVGSVGAIEVRITDNVEA